MAATKASDQVTDSYFVLVRRFPLVPIRNEKHLNEAAAIVDGLLKENLDSGASAYLEVLSDLVENYEDTHHEIEDASEASVLRLLMKSNGLKQSELARSVGISASTISAVLNGARSLTRQQIVGLASYFRVAPGVFLPAR